MRQTPSPPPTCSPRSAPPRRSRTPRPPASSTSPPAGPTSTHPSPSTPPPRSPSAAPTTRNRSLARVSAGRGVLHRRARYRPGISTTSAKKLIGHALELRHCLPRLWSQVQSGTSRRGGHAPSPRPPSTPRPHSLVRPLRSWTPRSPPSPDGSAPPSSTASSRRRSSGTTSPQPDPAADPEDGYLSCRPTPRDVA